MDAGEARDTVVELIIPSDAASAGRAVPRLGLGIGLRRRVRRGATSSWNVIIHFLGLDFDIVPHVGRCDQLAVARKQTAGD